MKLYFSPGACSLASHIVLRELGVPFELVKVDTAAKKTAKGEDYLAINPKGYVPAVQLDNGQVLTEGAALLQYLGELKPGLLPTHGPMDKFRENEWLVFISSEIHKGFSPLFNKDLSDDAKKIFIKKLEQRFTYLDKQLANHDYLMGKQFTVADAYAFTVLSWAHPLKIDLSPWPNLAAYVKRVGDRPKVKEAQAAEK
jgi:glutathione S-transferase